MLRAAPAVGARRVAAGAGGIEILAAPADADRLLGAEQLLRAASSCGKPLKSASAAVRTRSGARCSSSDVSTSPPWMSCATSAAIEQRPAAPRTRNRWRARRASPSSARRRIATRSTSAFCPPCVLRRSRACARPCARRCGRRRSTHQQASYPRIVSVPREARVLGAQADVQRGQDEQRRAGGHPLERRAHEPSLMRASVDSGRCGPCCSTAATGSSATVASGSTRRKSAVVRSCQ